MLTTIQNYEIVNKVPMTCFKGSGATLHLVNTKEEWAAFFELLMKQKLVACDTETTGFQYYKEDRVCGLSFGWDDLHFYIPLRHKDSIQDGPVCDQLDIDEIREDLRTFFSQKDVFTIWHNWKFDAHFYRADGIEIRTPFHDTLILWKFFNENAPAALKIIASGWYDDLGRWTPGIVDPKANEKEKLISKWRSAEASERRKEFTRLVKEKADELVKDPQYQSMTKRDLKKFVKDSVLNWHPYKEAKKEDIGYDLVPVPLMCQYAGLDTYFTWKIYQHVMANMPMPKRLKDLYVNEIKLSRALMEAEEAGLTADRAYLEDLRSNLKKDIESTTTEILSKLGNINLASNDQLSEALSNYGVVLTKRTPTGKLAVDAKVLNKLKKEYPVVDQILELRTLEKLLGTYCESILDKMTDDNILHCSFNQNVSTGRMSSTDPNLQNIPARDKSIRRAFTIRNSEYIQVFLDYSQIEVRLTAHYSQDPLLLSAYELGQDVHTRTMCEMFGFNYDVVSDVLENDSSNVHYAEWAQLRTIAKRINFGIIYGVGAPGLSEQIPRPAQFAEISDKAWVQVCQKYIDNYLDKYRGVRKFIRTGGRLVAKDAQVENYFGRVRHLPHAHATKILKDRSKSWLESRAQRQGVNFLVQGTAADLFKIAVVRVHEILKGTKSCIVNFVHDEIQLMLHRDEVHLLPTIKRAMEDFPQFTVPIVADIEFSTTNWAEKKSL